MLIWKIIRGYHLKPLILKSLLLCASLSLGTQPDLRAGNEIHGKIKLDTIWEPVIYLCYIPTFNDMYRIANEMILAKTDIDSLGYFSINTSYLPSEDNLYRIHISKKGDPPASLIIGGIEENHFFLIANNKVDINIITSGKERIFKNISIEGYSPNKGLTQIDEVASYVDSSGFDGSIIRKEFVTKAIYEKLRFIADTSKHPLISLYALYKSNFESNFPINQEFYKRFLNKWENEKSAYFTHFRTQIPLNENKEVYTRILIAFISLIIGFILAFLWKSKKKSTKKLVSLSVQERRIFNLVRLGKSNKEISDECNIGVSTVKSHINSIYSKLDIKSRKEAINY